MKTIAVQKVIIFWSVGLCWRVSLIIRECLRGKTLLYSFHYRPYA